jgi:OTU domain-containing protein 6
MADDEDLESLVARHKKEQKALVSQITSLKKTVTKGEKAKRKEVLLEVDRLEKELNERHQQELQQIKDRERPPKDSATLSTVLEGQEESVQTGPNPDVEQLKLVDDTPAFGEKSKGGRTKVSRQAARLVKRSILN